MHGSDCWPLIGGNFKVPFGPAEARRWSHLTVLATLPAPTPPQQAPDKKSICQPGPVLFFSFFLPAVPKSLLSRG